MNYGHHEFVAPLQGPDLACALLVAKILQNRDAYVQRAGMCRGNCANYRQLHIFSALCQLTKIMENLWLDATHNSAFQLGDNDNINSIIMNKMENFQSVSKSIKMHLITFLCNNSDHINGDGTMSHSPHFFSTWNCIFQMIEPYRLHMLSD